MGFSVAPRIFYLDFSNENSSKSKGPTSQRLALEGSIISQRPCLYARIERKVMVTLKDVTVNEVPQHRWEWIAVEGSDYRIDVDGMAGVIIQAFDRDELVGESAKDAMHAVFWKFFVNCDEGLTYMGRYSPETELFYLRCRIDVLASQSKAAKAICDAVHHAPMGSTAATKTVTDGWVLLRTCEHAINDTEFGDAIEALQTMAASEDERSLQIIQICGRVGLIEDPTAAKEL